MSIVDTLQSDSRQEELLNGARAASNFLKAIGHESRLTILCALCEGEFCVRDLENLLKQPQPTISQQRARLRAENMVTTRREGKTVYYSLASEEARAIVGIVYRRFCSTGAAATSGQ